MATGIIISGNHDAATQLHWKHRGHWIPFHGHLLGLFNSPGPSWTPDFPPSPGASPQHCRIMNDWIRITEWLLPSQQPSWGMDCSEQSWSPASIHPLSKVSVQEHMVVMLTMQMTHFTFRRNCFNGITLAWPCWDHCDNPPEVGLETINPKKGSRLVPFTSPRHHRAKKPTTKPSRALLFIYLIFWETF